MKALEEFTLTLKGPEGTYTTTVLLPTDTPNWQARGMDTLRDRLWSLFLASCSDPMTGVGVTLAKATGVQEDAPIIRVRR